MAVSSMKNKDSVLYQMRVPLENGLKNYYFNIATNIFKWKNLPKEIPIRYPERTLYESGASVFFKPKEGLPYMALPVIQGSIRKNPYGEPSKWRALALGELAGIVNSIELNEENSVFIRNDFAYVPTKPYVDMMVEQLVNVELTARMNINAQKMPYMFKGSEDTVLQNKNTFKEFMECEPVYFKTEYANSEFEIYYSGVPFLANDLTKTYTEYDARILSYLGINNLAVEKNERLISGEVDINNQETSLIRKARYEQRKLASDKINDLFGLDVSIEIEEMDDMKIGEPQKTNKGNGDDDDVQ